MLKIYENFFDLLYLKIEIHEFNFSVNLSVCTSKETKRICHLSKFEN